jgi:hypothetical protein
MIFGKDERRRTIRTPSENLTKSTEIAAFWQGSFYSWLALRGVRGDLSPSFVNLPLRQISAEGIPLLRETAVPESYRPAAPKYKTGSLKNFPFYIMNF